MNDAIKTMLAEALNKLVTWAKTQGTEIGKNLATDAAQFMAASAQDLARWSQMALDGVITPDELKSLVKGQAELAVMRSCTQAGLALVEVEKLRNQMLDTVAGLIGAGVKTLK